MHELEDDSIDIDEALAGWGGAAAPEGFAERVRMAATTRGPSWWWAAVGLFLAGCLCGGVAATMLVDGDRVDGLRVGERPRVLTLSGGIRVVVASGAEVRWGSRLGHDRLEVVEGVVWVHLASSEDEVFAGPERATFSGSCGRVSVVKEWFGWSHRVDVDDVPCAVVEEQVQRAEPSTFAP